MHLPLVRCVNFVAFDLETTGLDIEQDRIVEFCFISLDADLQETARWTERVNPGVPIPAEVIEVHGITEQDVADKPTFDAFAAKIQDLLKDATLIAYNHDFDVGLLHHELLRHGQKGIPMDVPVIDPSAIFRQHFPHSLAGAVRLYLDRELVGAHGAEADTAAMLDVLRAQRRHGRDDDAPVRSLLFQRRHNYLDRGRRFYEDDDGLVRFNFGKHRNKLARDEANYLQWMLGADFAEDTKTVIRRILQ